MTRRLLLVSYHFGSEAETGGLRWNAMAHHLAETGWLLEVITAARPGLGDRYTLRQGVRVSPVAVPTSFGDTLEGIGRLRRRVLKPMRGPDAPDKAAGARAIRAPGSRSLAGGSGVLSALYHRLMPNVGSAARWSAEAGWTRRAVRVGLSVAKSHTPSVVAVSSPPHPTHLAGTKLADALRVPYLADFRDPWIPGGADEVHSTGLDGYLGGRARSRVFRAATRIVFNTTWAARDAERHAPLLAGRIAVIPNGYDRLAFIGPPDVELFRVAFVGWLYDFMDPESVLAACARLRARENTQALRVEFVGTDSAPGGVELRSRARVHGLEPWFEHRARVSREEALRIQQRAAVQVVFDYPSPLRIPMKFYDAVQMRGDLLLIGRRQSALGDAAAQIGCPVCRPDDDAAIDRALHRAWNRWRARDYAASADPTGIFARQPTTQKMQELLEELAAGRDG